MARCKFGCNVLLNELKYFNQENKINCTSVHAWYIWIPLNLSGYELLDWYTIPYCIVYCYCYPYCAYRSFNTLTMDKINTWACTTVMPTSLTFSLISHCHSNYLWTLSNCLPCNNWLFVVKVDDFIGCSFLKTGSRDQVHR